jgi:hypothetical protein
MESGLFSAASAASVFFSKPHRHARRGKVLFAAILLLTLSSNRALTVKSSSCKMETCSAYVEINDSKLVNNNLLQPNRRACTRRPSTRRPSPLSIRLWSVP